MPFASVKVTSFYYIPMVISSLILVLNIVTNFIDSGIAHNALRSADEPVNALTSVMHTHSSG